MRIKTALLASGWLALALPPALAAPSAPTSLSVQQDQPKSTYALISATIIDEFGEPMMGVSVCTGQWNDGGLHHGRQRAL